MLVLKKSMVSLFCVLIPLISFAAETTRANVWENEIRQIVTKAQDNANLQMANAKGVVEKIHSPELTKTINQARDKVRNVLNIQDVSRVSNEKRKIFNLTPVLFVSSSMPTVALRRYAYDLSKIGGVMVIRGGVDGLARIKNTLYFGQKVLAKNIGCSEHCQFIETPLLIDPVLFQRFHIDKVPALILAKHVNEPHCKDNIPNEKISVVYGDASLRGMLETLQTLTVDSEINQMVDKI